MTIVKTTRFNGLCFAAALAFANSHASAAQWDSLRGNNRGGGEIHAGRGAVTAPAVRDNERERAPVVQNHLPPPGRIEDRHVDEHRRVEIQRDTRERRHWDMDADRRHSYFWFGYHPGMVVNVLPPDYSQVYVAGTPYYYDQGVYYENGSSGYTVVAPPLGAVVPNLPPGAESVVAGPTVYYYAGGAFYLPQPQGFIVVAPPLGVTVSAVPPGANPVIINGVQYYEFNGVYFMPVMQNGVVVYATVRP